MSKFKVGDKFLVIDDEGHYEIWNGDVVSLFEDDGTSEKYYEDKHGVVVCIPDNRLKHIPDTSNTLQLGQTYTSENGYKWECIFVRDGKAWLVGVYDGKAEGSAYGFDVDGTAYWVRECDRAAYNIVFEPVRETVVKHIETKHGYLTLEYTIADGTPDWKNAKVTPCD